MADRQISPQALDRALTYLRTPASRSCFVHELSNERGNYESQDLGDVQFSILTWLFRAAFDAMLVDGKCPDRSAFGQDTLLLMNMSMTYFRMVGGERQYIAESLRTHPAFAEFGFWELAYKAEAREKFREQSAMCGYSDGFGESVQNSEVSGAKE